MPQIGPSDISALNGSTVTSGENSQEPRDGEPFSEFLPTEGNDPLIQLKNLKETHRDRPVIAQLNINFLYPKFHPLMDMVKESVDVLMVSETKLDDTFTTAQFHIEGFQEPIRLDRNKNGGGIMIFIRDGLDSKEIKSHKLKNAEGTFIKLVIRNTKWLIMAGYNPDKKKIGHFLNIVGRELDKLVPQYDNLLLLGDFNSEISEEEMKNFCEAYDLTNLITEPTCFKSVENPSSIDVILTNRKQCFEDSRTIETGLSDCHKMTVTVMKKFYKKLEPVVIEYHDYSSFNGDNFRADLKRNLENCVDLSIENFKSIFDETLNFHAPKKKKVVRGNNAPFMNRTLSKAFMTRARLRNKYFKFPTPENKLSYTKHKNFCTNLLKREKKKYYTELDVKILEDNKKFWQKVKPLFSEKSMIKQSIRLNIDGKIVSEKKQVAEILNNYFMDAVENLEIERYLPNIIINDDGLDDIDKMVRKYQDHPSIVKIKENVKVDKPFEFQDVDDDVIFKKILSLNSGKASMKDDIPPKFFLGTNDIICKPISTLFNRSKNVSIYPKPLKTADVTALPKDANKDNPSKYRPVSLIPTLSKIFEKVMFDQITNFAESFLSPYLFAYRTGHNGEQCLTVMIEMWRKALDEHKIAGAILTDLSKAFDCLSHDLLIAKLHAYGFGKSALKFVLNYLSDRTQRVKVDGEYSEKRKLKYGVPQGSILGPLLFNLFMNDIFYFMKESNLANYADDTSTYVCKEGIFPFLHALKSETTTVLNWFKINEMKSNSDKCHLIVSENRNRLYKSNTCIYLDEDNELLHNESIVKLLGVFIDDELTFEEHVKAILKKGNQKLHALMRVSSYMSEEKLKLLMKTFIDSQFNYCPLIWMFHSRKMHHRINKLHERALRVVYKDDNLTFEQLLEKDEAFTVHERNLQRLALLMYKVKHGLCPIPVQEIFIRNESDINLRHGNKDGDFIIPRVRTVNYGKETLRYRGPVIWNLLPDNLRNIPTLEKFKEEIKKWKPLGCKCRLCTPFVKDLGYI